MALGIDLCGCFMAQLIEMEWGEQRSVQNLHYFFSGEFFLSTGVLLLAFKQNLFLPKWDYLI
jgi:hypothetical protein